MTQSFPIIAVLLLAPWPVAYGYNDDATTTNQPVQVILAESSAAPSCSVFGKAISGVKPGDLFYINADNQPADMTVTLHMTNSQELVHNFRYIILKVGVYIKDDAGSWVKASQVGGDPITDTFITLQNGQVSFSLAGFARYKLTIDSGSLNCITARGSTSPQFYLEVS